MPIHTPEKWEMDSYRKRSSSITSDYLVEKSKITEYLCCMKLNSVCVYCGSSEGTNPVWKSTAFEFGSLLAEKGITLVYGGGSVGLMGAVADGALSKNGKVIGVIPEALKSLELDHKSISDLHVVNDMHERKMAMANLSDAFVALPGGIGTLEELFEAFTWKQLSFHQKPCSVLNIDGYYDHMISFLQHSVTSGFLKQSHLDDLIIATEMQKLLQTLQSAEHTPREKWQ